MNKWLFKNMFWLYNITANIRMFWFIVITNQIDNAKQIITEHFDW